MSCGARRSCGASKNCCDRESGASKNCREWKSSDALKNDGGPKNHDDVKNCCLKSSDGQKNCGALMTYGAPMSCCDQRSCGCS